MENADGTNEGRDLRFANKLRGTERRPQVYRRDALYWWKHPLGQQNETEKSSYGMDCLKKGKWYSPPKLDNRQSKNVQDSRWRHKVYRKYHVQLESRTDSRRKKLNSGENSARILPGRYAITITISNCDNATQSHTYKMHRWVQAP